ncbi:hypothetical protein ANO11243_009510 [Dothideomycetidae sp. 11243]|nr:hypothetical protein ANO11243_009510 [fungal sp. No.11243]
MTRVGLVKMVSFLQLALASNASGARPGQSYVSSNVTPPYLQVNSTGRDLAPGLLFYTPTAGVDENASILRLGPLISSDTGDLVWAGPISDDASNLRVQTLNGQPVVSFWEGTGAAASGLLAGHGYGPVQIYNTSYDLIATICPKLNITHPPGQESDCDADVHESYITDDNTILVTAYNITKADLTSIGGPQEGYVYDSLIVEIDIASGEIVFLWSPLEHVPVGDSKYPLGKAGHTVATAYDFFHANSIFPWEDGYLINSRHTWTTYYVDKCGDIIWRIDGAEGGDFGSIPAGGLFAWQHNAEIVRVSPTEATIPWFANNNDIAGQTNVTTGVQLALTLPPDPSNPPRLLSNVSDPAQPIFSSAEGSHQIFDNRDHLLGYGFQPYIHYFDARGEAIWSARYAFENGASSYRVFKQEWHAVPSTSPDLVVQKGDNGQLVGYVSWNGATHVEGYNVYAGSDVSVLKLVGVAVKKGFETEFRFKDDGSSLFQIGAVVPRTREERKSAVVAVS